jgi:hypothetical protein
MRVLRNLTLHKQGPREKALADERGLALAEAPEGVEMQPGESLEDCARMLADKLRSATAHGESALVGGHTGLWIAAVLLAEAVPEMYCFETRRILDENGRFVFVPDRLIRVPGRSEDFSPD